MHGFELVRDEQVAEMNSRVRLYKHSKTGAQLLSVENNDENKVFGITFFTPPPSSNGLPHILEHSVLNGSRKYPIKDPFVQLLKGSLATFVNAMTYPDKTTYPVASQNVRDFYNLIDVYLDAVFYPRITPYTLQQEGWHYELEAPNQPMIYKGVVFNEMKGAYSSPDRLVYEYSQQSLFPDNFYGLDSGGNPGEIPNLTWEEFKKFHETYYHPSNALIWFYGDDDPEERLRIIDGYLRDYNALQIDRTIPPQPRFTEPKRLTYYYDAGQDDADRKAMVTLNWLLTDVSDPELLLALGILDHILIGTPASPLRKALIDSGLGESLTGAGFEAEVNPTFYSTGLKGIAPEDGEKVEALILETLQKLAKDGIDPAQIEASVNTIEFQLRENNTGNFPRGLALMLRALTIWLHGVDPYAALAFEKPLGAIKAKLANGERLFEGLIERFLLNNTHRTTMLLHPDSTLRARREKEEQGRLLRARAGMSQADVQAVIDNTRELKRLQETPNTPEELATLPFLKLSDLDKKNKIIPRETGTINGATLLYHDLFTNGIVYLDLAFNLRALKPEYLPYIGLFSRALLEMGTEQEDYVRLSQRIGRKTGGITTTRLSSMTHDNDTAVWLILRGKATVAQGNDLLAILRDILLTLKLDNKERFRQILLEEKARREAQLIPMGHATAFTRLRSAFNPADWASEQMGGVSYLFFMRELIDRLDADWPKIQSDLEAIRRALLNRNTTLVNVTLDAGNWSAFQPGLTDFVAGLPAAPQNLIAWTPDYAAHPEGLTIPAQVNYVAKGADLFKAGYEPHGSAQVVSNFLRTAYLWDKIRVQGGAYGAFCQFSPLSGMFTYASYRDPNLLNTLDVYDATAKFLADVPLNDDEVTRNIIGTIADIDAYQLPDAKGYTSMVEYVVGETEEIKQRERDEVLGTTAADFRKFADALDAVNRQGRVVVLGSQEAINDANAKRGNFLKVIKVL